MEEETLETLKKVIDVCDNHLTIGEVDGKIVILSTYGDDNNAMLNLLNTAFYVVMQHAGITADDLSKDRIIN